jgi:hypothetical protein
MIYNSKFKKLGICTLLIALVFSLSSILCFAKSESSDVTPVYFDYWDGVCRDGSVGDKAGIIGDEEEAIEKARRDKMTSSLVGGNNNNINDNFSASDSEMRSSTDLNTTQSTNKGVSMIFWGIIISLIIGGAIILLVVMMTPKNTGVRKE